MCFRHTHESQAGSKSHNWDTIVEVVDGHQQHAPARRSHGVVVELELADLNGKPMVGPRMIYKRDSFLDALRKLHLLSDLLWIIQVWLCFDTNKHSRQLRPARHMTHRCLVATPLEQREK